MLAVRDGLIRNRLTIGREIIQSFSKRSDVCRCDMLEFIHMNDQFVPTCECLIANLANVPMNGCKSSAECAKCNRSFCLRLFPCMNSHMNRQFIFARQTFTANSTLECLVSCEELIRLILNLKYFRNKFPFFRLTLGWSVLPCALRCLLDLLQCFQPACRMHGAAFDVWLNKRNEIWSWNIRRNVWCPIAETL